MLSSTSEGLLDHLTRYSTTRDVWNALHSMFSCQNHARKTQIRTQLSTRKKKDLSATEYFQKMKSLADTMAAVGHPMDDEEVIGYMITGLGPEYEPMIASVMAHEDPIDLNTFYSQLLSAEVRYEQNAATGEMF